MPPKKPGIYLADYHDCFNFIELLGAALSRAGDFPSYNPFSSVPAQFFAHLRGKASYSDEEKLILGLFDVIDSLDQAKEFRVARNALEMALLDMWGQVLCVPTASLVLGDNWNVKRPTYYTIGINSDLNEMKESAKFGIQHTPYLKLKMDKNVAFWESWLPQLHKYCAELTKGRGEAAELNGRKTAFVWSVDANADWSPEVAKAMLPVLEPYKDIISMVEQPFAAHLSATEHESWKEIKTLYNSHGFVIYADESVSTSADIDHLVDVAHGVNIKLDKTGGVREALRTYKKARDAELGVWIGIMVSSRLSTTMASCVLPLSTLGGDLDGQLLVHVNSDKFTGGLNWDTTTGLCSPPSAPGLGLSLK